MSACIVTKVTKFDVLLILFINYRNKNVVTGSRFCGAVDFGGKFWN